MIKILKNYTVFGALVCLVLTSCSEKTIDFKCQFIGDREYLQTTTSNSKNEISYSGDEEFVEYMQAKNPGQSESTTRIVSLIRTDKDRNGTIPLSIEYLETNKDNPNSPIQDGDTFFGSYSDNSSLKLDSASSKNISGPEKEQFLDFLAKGFETLIFDCGEMKIGDSSVIEFPLSLPLGDQQVELIFITTYTLREINDNIAEFDISQHGTLELNHEGSLLTAIGSGEGTCSYSIKDQYLTKNSVNLLLDMKMDIGSNRKVKITVDSLSEVECEITEVN